MGGWAISVHFKSVIVTLGAMLLSFMGHSCVDDAFEKDVRVNGDEARLRSPKPIHICI